jgi:glucokinase
MKIVFDIGGTKFRIARSADGKTLEQSIVLKTPQSYDDALAMFKEQVSILAEGQEIESIAGGVPGMLNPAKTEITRIANLPEWSGKNLVTDLQTALNCQNVKLENDAALGALGESLNGAGKSYNSVGYITIGTGIGGAWVIDSKLVLGSYSFDPGHQVINSNGPLCPSCEKAGHLESYIGTPELKESLMIGLYNTMLYWPTDVIVLGGGVTLHSNWNTDEIKQSITDLSHNHIKVPEIKFAELGDESGLYGALSLS